MRRVIGILVCFVLLTGPAAYAAQPDGAGKAWDVGAASRQVGARARKPYTIMLYMNGSDLESESGAATDDLIQILESGMASQNAHFIIFTGGTKRWQNDIVPDNECALWEVADGLLYKTAGVGKANMGDPGTLSSFISFGLQNYPADRYGLILWDHGGGAIVGYGLDEKYAEGNLTLLDMKAAFEEAGLRDKKLAFLGFDSCLMATAEMAVVASDYARLLVASEDLEPGEGWDYTFLSVLNQTPPPDEKTLAVAIVDYFMAYYGADTDELLTLSVADLSHARAVMDAVGELTRLGSDHLTKDRAGAFNHLARRRVNTKTFGEGSPKDNECDMVDIGDMARKLSDLYPAEAAKVTAALEKCVLYNRSNSDVAVQGLSTYYIFGGKEWGEPSLETYAALNVNASYTQYLRQFYAALTDSGDTRRRSRSAAETAAPALPVIETETVLWQPIKTNAYRMVGLAADAPLSWPRLNGRSVCLFPTCQSCNNKQYAIPAEVNGRACDIIVLFNDKYPGGLVEGARHKAGPIIQKGYDPIAPGDKIALYFLEIDAQNRPGWQKTAAFTVKDALTLTWGAAPAGCQIGQRITDIKGDAHYVTPGKGEKV